MINFGQILVNGVNQGQSVRQIFSQLENIKNDWYRNQFSTTLATPKPPRLGHKLNQYHCGYPNTIYIGTETDSVPLWLPQHHLDWYRIKFSTTVATPTPSTLVKKLIQYHCGYPNTT